MLDVKQELDQFSQVFEIYLAMETSLDKRMECLMLDELWGRDSGDRTASIMVGVKVDSRVVLKVPARDNWKDKQRELILVDLMDRRLANSMDGISADVKGFSMEMLMVGSLGPDSAAD